MSRVCACGCGRSLEGRTARAKYASDACRLHAYKGRLDATEADWLKTLIDTARLFGWRVAHFRPARTKHGWATPVQADGKGYPDLTMVHPGRRCVIFAEVKVGRNQPSAEQERWLEDLRAAFIGMGAVDRGYVRLWRMPDDFDEALELLRRKAA